MTTLSRRLLPWLIVMLLIGAQAPVVAQESAAREQSLAPLESLLQADGTLNLQTGFSGSLDPRGWTLASKPGQAPRFVRASESREAAAGFEPGVPSVPGDEFWDALA